MDSFTQYLHNYSLSFSIGEEDGIPSAGEVASDRGEPRGLSDSVLLGLPGSKVLAVFLRAYAYLLAEDLGEVAG